METSIIELVMGLVLVYATLALLLMKIQESMFGNFFRARVSNLHTLVREATMQDDELAKALYANPLIFPLSTGEAARPTHWSWSLLPFSRATGPSAIPPDLFARALLMELNGGIHPRHKFSAPLNFLEKQLKDQPQPAAGQPPARRLLLLKALHGLVANKEGSWDDFEAAVASWFQDIGDRSNGWFKRSSDRFAFRAAIVLCVVLNVDSLNMVNVLSADPELRVGLANLAEDVSRLHESEKTGAKPPANEPRAPVASSPAARATSRLVDANAQLREAFFKDAAIAGYGRELQPLREYCDVIPEVARSKGLKGDSEGRTLIAKRYASNADGWLDVIPGLLPVIEAAALGMNGSSSFNPEQPLPMKALEAASQAAGHAASAAKLAIKKKDEVAAAAASAHEAAASAMQYSQETLNKSGTKLERARYCLIQVSSWVRSASTASDRPDTRKAMQDAAVALEESKAALTELIEGAQRGRSSARLRNLFLTQPQDFRTCLEDKPTGSDAFLACMRSNQELVTRLPLGWGEANRQRQFCRVSRPLPTEPARNCPPATAATGAEAASAQASVPACRAKTPAAAAEAVEDWLCPSLSAGPAPALGLSSELTIVARPNAWFYWAVGVLISAFFVALGAPFWFDLLSRLVKLRAAGKVREAAETEAQGRGTLPLPSLAGPGAGAGGTAKPSPSGSLAGQPGIVTGVQGSKNSFEDKLLPRELMALQAALGVTQTAVLDAATRDAIRKAQSERGLGDSNELSLASYTALVRRPPEHADLDLGQIPVRPTRGLPHPYLAALRDNLQAMLRMPSSLKINAKLFDDDLRAMAVLYRVKQEYQDQSNPKRYATLTVVEQARAAPTVLDQVDETWMNRILASRAQDPHLDRNKLAPWMDWAWGELGQVEANADSVAASNPRICAYLAAAGDAGAGDKTAWCGAFVAWVLKRHNSLDLDKPDQALPAKQPTQAKSWTAWTRPASPTTEAPTASAASPELTADAAAAAAAVITVAAAFGITADHQYGDVVVVQTNPSETSPDKASYHVGLFVEVEGAERFWMLGGNQATGGRVCLSCWPRSSIRTQQDLPA